MNHSKRIALALTLFALFCPPSLAAPAAVLAAPAIEFSRRLGGSGGDLVRAIGVDGQGNIYLAGYTGSPDFPLVNPILPGHGSPGLRCPSGLHCRSGR